MSNEYLDIVKDQKKMQKQLVFCSAFILVYEYFISSWKQGLFFLYTNCKTDIEANSALFHTDVIFRKLRYEAFVDLEKEHKSIKNTIQKEYNKLLSKQRNKTINHPLFLWMSEYGFITKQDLTTLEKCRVQRNKYGHEMDQILKKTITNEEKELFESLVNIASTASKKWNEKVKGSSPTIKDYLDELADTYNIDRLKFKTNTELFYSLTLANIKDLI